MVCFATLASASPAWPQRISAVIPLDPAEGVFAYARIAPDGRAIAYAAVIANPSNPREKSRVIRVVDMSTKRILFTESGIDAYWSPDGGRLIYKSLAAAQPQVSIWNKETGAVVRGIVPVALGDYYSWAQKDGQDLILTVRGAYFVLDGQRALPPDSIPRCPGIGMGDRPLISKDGRHVSVFSRGTIHVRNLGDCGLSFDTGIEGAKADFSWDGRYLAFHATKPQGDGYDIKVVDLQEHTVRQVTHLPGESLFPSWTRDGRLCFRHRSDQYYGFLMAEDFLSAPAVPLPGGARRKEPTTWSELFPETTRPLRDVTVVLVWAPWSAHAPDAFAALDRARRLASARGLRASMLVARDPYSSAPDAERFVSEHGVGFENVQLSRGAFHLTGGQNQMPLVMLFRGDRLVETHLGDPPLQRLAEWLGLGSARGF